VLFLHRFLNLFPDKNARSPQVVSDPLKRKIPASFVQGSEKVGEKGDNSVESDLCSDLVPVVGTEVGNGVVTLVGSNVVAVVGADVGNGVVADVGSDVVTKVGEKVGSTVA